jgi:hypothetical protein
LARSGLWPETGGAAIAIAFAFAFAFAVAFAFRPALF